MAQCLPKYAPGCLIGIMERRVEGDKHKLLKFLIIVHKIAKYHAKFCIF